MKNFRDDVRQVITDVKTPIDTDNDSIADYYSANVIQSSDSYPFGWDIKERSFTVDNYRFSFNGKENDPEWGNQHVQDYGFRLYNPALGKFLSVDPLAPQYPELTTYQFASNSPIKFIDLDGLEGLDNDKFRREYKRNYESQLKVTVVENNESFADGVISGVKNKVITINRFVHRDMWMGSTWSSVNNFITLTALTRGNNIVHGVAQDFSDRVINGTSFSRGEYLGEASFDAALGAPKLGGIKGRVSEILRDGIKTKGGGQFFGRSTPNAFGSTLNSGLNPFNLSGKFFLRKIKGQSIEGTATAIGRMETLKKYSNFKNVDTWHKTGRMPSRDGGGPVTWAENRKWLQDRIDRGDTFIMTMNPDKLPTKYVKDQPNGWFTKMEYDYLKKKEAKIIYDYKK